METAEEYLVHFIWTFLMKIQYFSHFVYAQWVKVKDEAYNNLLHFLCFLNRKDMIRQMMTKIFRCIEPELNNLIALGDKIDSFNSLYMLVKMSHHVWTAQNVDPASFLSTTLGNVLVTVKRNFDKCIVSSFLIT